VIYFYAVWSKEVYRSKPKTLDDLNNKFQILLPPFFLMGRDSSVGIATRYELDGPGIECRWGRNFQHPSRPALLFYSFFCFNAPCQYTLFLNLHPLIFGLTPIGWLRSITLSRTYSIIPYENISFDLRLFN
jgi:hypothetical protein